MRLVVRSFELTSGAPATPTANATHVAAEHNLNGTARSALGSTSLKSSGCLSGSAIIGVVLTGSPVGVALLGVTCIAGNELNITESYDTTTSIILLDQFQEQLHCAYEQCSWLSPSSSSGVNARNTTFAHRFWLLLWATYLGTSFMRRLNEHKKRLVKTCSLFCFICVLFLVLSVVEDRSVASSALM